MTALFKDDVRQIAALNRLELIGPDEVVDWASERIAVIESDALLGLATLRKPASRLEVHEFVSKLLEESQLDPVDLHQAGIEVAKRLAQQILDGSVAPGEGARRIWWDISHRSPSLEAHLRPFRALASGWEDDVAHQDEYERDILEEARRLLLWM